MGKRKISKTRSASSDALIQNKVDRLIAEGKLFPHDPGESLRDASGVVETLLWCIEMGDIEAFQDVLIGYMHVSNKTALAKAAGLGRQTMYDLMNPEKEFNPSLKTITSLIDAIKKAA